MDTSSKIQDTIAISTHINQGPPARYLLGTKKRCLDKEGMLRRCTFGERDHTKLNKTILIVGETGTGKSTLINAMVNHVLGVEWEDKVWFEIIKEEKRSQTESQTTGVTIYEIFRCEALRVPYSLTIIDTPGYGDTRGLQEDKIISEKLFKLFRSADGIHQLDAVGLVVKASENRLSDRLQYIFESVLSLFGKDMEKSIVTLITHSDGMPPKNMLEAITAAKVPCAKNNKDEPVHFLFNNCQCELIDENYASKLKSIWEEGSISMQKFFTSLNYMETKSVKMTEGVLRERKQLEASIRNLQERIEEIERKQNEIKQTQRALEKNKTNDFSYEVEETYKEKVPTKEQWDNKATTCTVCKENCHYPGCWWVQDLSWCSVMNKDYCTVCTGKCHFSKHIKEKKKYVTKTRKVTRTFKELKYKYDREAGDDVNVIIRLQKEAERDFEAEKHRLVEESYQCVVKLEKTALNAISPSTAQHLGFLIEKMKETGFTEKVQKLEEMKKKAEEHKVWFINCRR